ncbi:hypothetical protein OS965_27505 [Streptomyces sp. H27-G5]|uniref:hypothetical protein n=1 Tax=Streptomyces sp. H27-G5 TaxID=2996698 RepID=UPI00226ECB36|nr:hypothetical protein [Streptomyces sp. H27-G5]MCY0921870.1 hypothetical protein [Streptomyces sp. H27-G5]
MSRPRACESLAVPHGPGPARLYPCGWRCSLHTPNAMAGRPESPPGPGWPAGSYLTRPAPTEVPTSSRPHQ